MTQRQLDLVDWRLTNENFENIVFLENEVICEINDRFSLIIRRKRHTSHVLLKGGKRRMKLPLNIFECICNAHISVVFLKQFYDK